MHESLGVWFVLLLTVLIVVCAVLMPRRPRAVPIPVPVWMPVMPAAAVSETPSLPTREKPKRQRGDMTAAVRPAGTRKRPFQPNQLPAGATAWLPGFDNLRTLAPGDEIATVGTGTFYAQINGAVGAVEFRATGSGAGGGSGGAEYNTQARKSSGGGGGGGGAGSTAIVDVAGLTATDLVTVTIGAGGGRGGEGGESSVLVLRDLGEGETLQILELVSARGRAGQTGHAGTGTSGGAGGAGGVGGDQPGGHTTTFSADASLLDFFPPILFAGDSGTAGRAGAFDGVRPPPTGAEGAPGGIGGGSISGPGGAGGGSPSQVPSRTGQLGTAYGAAGGGGAGGVATRDEVLPSAAGGSGVFGRVVFAAA